MAHDNETPFYSLPAATDFSALTSPFRFGVINGSGQFALCGAGARAHVALSNPVKAGQMSRAWLRHGAIRKIEAGAAIAAQAKVMSDATGRAITATSTNAINGIALQAAGAAGDRITVLFDPSLGAAP